MARARGRRFNLLLSNHRLVGFKDGRVPCRWKDYAAGSQQKVMTVSADELLTIPPPRSTERPGPHPPVRALCQPQTVRFATALPRAAQRRHRTTTTCTHSSDQVAARLPAHACDRTHSWRAGWQDAQRELHAMGASAFPVVEDDIAPTQWSPYETGAAARAYGLSFDEKRSEPWRHSRIQADFDVGLKEWRGRAQHSGEGLHHNSRDQQLTAHLQSRVTYGQWRILQCKKLRSTKSRSRQWKQSLPGLMD